MDTEKLIFSIQEIPEGESQREISLKPGDVSLEGGVKLSDGDLFVNFFRATHFIEVKFNLSVSVILECDRSLREFDKDIEGSYHMIFEPDPEEEYETEKSAVKKISVEDLSIDITKEVRDTIMLQVPAKKVHPDYIDEAGNILDFETKTYGPPLTEDEKIDPRWAKLKKLK